MKIYQSTWNGTMTQARALVEAWKIAQKEKERKKKMAAWFSKNAAEWEKRDLIFDLIEKMGWRFQSDKHLKDILSITEDEDERSAIEYELGLREDINWHK